MMSGGIHLVLTCILLLLGYRDGVGVRGQVPGFSLRGISYPNHGLVLLSEVGDGADNSLECVSDNAACCSISSSFRGEYYFPDDNTVPREDQIGVGGYFRGRANDRVRLNRRGGTTAGLFRCQIRTQSNPNGENLYIGVYDESSGSPTVTNVVYDDAERFTCTSTGPATTVTWRRNCMALPNSADFLQAQTVTSTLTATYSNTLTIGSGVTDRDGVYTCAVTNTRGFNSGAAGLGADYTPNLPITVFITEGGSPVIGQSYTLTCLYTTAAGVPTSPVSFQWTGPDGNTVGTTNTLTLDPLSGDHRGEYSCLVTVGSGADTRLGCEVWLVAPPVTVTVTGGTVMAGGSHTLTCSDSGAPSGSTMIYSWSKGSTTLSSCITSQCTISGVQVSDAGDDYVCRVAVSRSGMLIAVGLGTGTLRVTLPSPVIRFRQGSFPPFYVGLDFDWGCDAENTGPLLPGVTADIVWSKDGNELTNTNRIIVGNVREDTPGSLWRHEVMFNPLSSVDSGSYTCTASIRPTTANAFVTNGMNTGMEEMTVVTPTLDVSVSDFTSRVLDVSPYNTFSLTCTATSRVNGAATPLTKTVQWMRSIDSSEAVELSSSTSGVTISNSNLDQPTSTSTITVNADTAGDHTYTCRVSLDVSPAPDDINGQDSTNIDVQGSVLPNAPTGLMNSSISHDRATIQWTVTSIAYDPETYIVQYGTASNSLTSSSSSVSSGNTITRTNFMLSVELTGLTLDTLYYYQVVATNTAGPTTSAAPPATFMTSGLPPERPTELQETELNSTNYMFSWRAPDVTNGDLTGHVMSCDPQVDGLGIISRNVSGDETMATLSGLENGVTYNCSVKAQNSAGSSPPSEPVTFTTDEAAPTASISGRFMLNRISTDARSISLSWAPPNLMDRNGDITSYTVTCRSSGVATITMTYSAAGTYTLGGFKPATRYTCDIVAANSAGMGPAKSSTVTTSEEAPSAPVDVMAVIVEGAPGNVSISWSPPSEPNGVIVHYDIMCTSAQGRNVSDRRVGSMSMNSISLTGLTPATRYTCSVTASTSAEGPPGMDDVLTLPAPPTITAVTEKTSFSLTVSWTYDDPPSGAVISGYSIFMDGAHVGTTSGEDMQYTITGLDPFTNYSIEVSAFNENEGLRSDVVTALTDEGLSGAVRCGSRWSTAENGSMAVTWDEPENTNGVVLNYVVTVMEYKKGSDILFTVLVDANDKSFTISTTDLRFNSGVPYNVSVAVNNSAGVGEKCVSTDFTDESTPPTNILDGLKLTRSEDNREINITWSVLSLNEAMGFVTLRITFSPASNGRRKRQASSMNECNTSPCDNVSYETGSVRITELNPSENYQVSVTPVNGESETGMPVVMETQGMPSGGVSLGIIIAVVVVVVLLVIAGIVVVIIILVCCCKGSKEGKYSPSYRDDEAVPMKGLDNKNRSPTPIDDASRPPSVVSPEMTIVDRLRPISVASFSGHVRAMHHDRDKGFEKEYESVNADPNASYDVAKLNKSKNRFANIFPYDFSRVKLQEITGVEGSEYVNASYIDGYGKADACIAAQGPMPNTVGDFWRMVFEHRLSTIVMLTKCTEAGKRKCEQYWSDNVNEVYSPSNTTLLVVLTEQMPFADYEIKKFSVTDSSQPNSPPLNVTHYHFLGWPDHGVPKFATSLIAFIRRVRSSFNKSGPPMLVHCSAGVGRTGTFILLDSMLERMRTENSVNVYEFLRNMRAKRVFMVQTQAQYVFIHDALDELITCGETDVAAHNLRLKISALHKVAPGSSHKKFADQFTLLDEVSRKPNDSDCSDGLQHYNQSKNRYGEKLPYNINRVRLRPTGVTGGEYINASFVDGYKHRNTYMAAQAPLESTVNDFWRMIWEFKSKAIVMLCDTHENGEETSYMFWPTGEGIPVTYGKLIVTLQSEEQGGELVTRKFEIKDDKSQPSSSLGGPSKAQSFVVTLFHYPQWPEKGRPNDVSLLLQVIESLTVVQRNTGNKPITVMCNDGMGRTGTFICIHAQLERIKTEGVVDFFQFIKSSRIHRPQLVSELEHYIFCHDALADYLDSFDNYANFKDLGPPSSM